MSINRALAKLENIDRIINRGKKTTLYMIDRFNDYAILGKIRLWNWEKVNPAGDGKPYYLIKVGQDRVATREILSECWLALNGVVHDVKKREEPKGNKEVMWIFRTLPTSETIEL